MKRLLPAALLAFLTSCGLIVPAAASAAIGAWTYHEYSNESGEIILAGTANEVYQAAESVARGRGTNLEVHRASHRILFDIEQANIKIQIIQD